MCLKELHFNSGNKSSFHTVQSLQTDGANNNFTSTHPQQALNQPHKLADESEWTRCKNNTFIYFNTERNFSKLNQNNVIDQIYNFYIKSSYL